MTARAVTLIKLYILTILAIWYDDWWNIGQWQLRIVTVRFELVPIKSHQIIHLICDRWAYFRWVCQFTLSFHNQQSNSDYFVVRMSKNEFRQLRKPFSSSLTFVTKWHFDDEWFKIEHWIPSLNQFIQLRGGKLCMLNEKMRCIQSTSTL